VGDRGFVLAKKFPGKRQLEDIRTQVLTGKLWGVILDGFSKVALQEQHLVAAITFAKTRHSWTYHKHMPDEGERMNVATLERLNNVPARAEVKSALRFAPSAEGGGVCFASLPGLPTLMNPGGSEPSLERAFFKSISWALVSTAWSRLFHASTMSFGLKPVEEWTALL
jgi:hypothetical protein